MIPDWGGLIHGSVLRVAPAAAAHSGVTGGRGFIWNVTGQPSGSGFAGIAVPDAGRYFDCVPVDTGPGFLPDRDDPLGPEEPIDGREVAPLAWPSGRGHWYRPLRRQVLGRLGLDACIFPEGYEGLITLGFVPVSRSIPGVRIPRLC